MRVDGPGKCIPLQVPLPRNINLPLIWVGFTFFPASVKDKISPQAGRIDTSPLSRCDSGEMVRGYKSRKAHKQMKVTVKTNNSMPAQLTTKSGRLFVLQRVFHKGFGVQHLD